MILPHVTDFEKVLSGEINQACFLLKPAPNFAGSTPGTQYVYETRDDIPIIWEEDGREDSIARVITVWGNTGGWLTGDLAVEPDWQEQLKWEQGCEYSVQRGGGKPTVWWRQCASKIEYAHECFEIDKDACAESDIYWTRDKAMSDYDHCDGLPLELVESGYRPLRIRITDIDQIDVRTFSDLDVQKMGYERFMDFIVPWVSKHDQRIKLKHAGFNDFGHERWRLTEKRRPDKFIQAGEGTIRDALKQRPVSFYDAWKLSFEPVKE